MVSEISNWFLSLSTYWQVGLYALLTALATGIGAIPFFFFKHIPEKYTSYGDALAAGLMLTASFKLVSEGTSYHLIRTLAGILVGMVLITMSRQKIDQNGSVNIGDLQGANALKAIMIVGVMTLHSFAEGVGVGVSFGGGQDFGVYISSAIAIHNIPEGLAISLVLISRGVSAWKCMLWSIFSSLPQPLLAVPSFYFVETFKPFLPFGLGFAAGAMFWMVASELLYDAFQHVSKQKVAIMLVIGIIIMVFLQEII